MLRELVASAQAGPAFGAQASFATLLDAWVAAKEPGWSKSTLRETKSIVGHHVRPRLGGVPVGAITTAQIDQMLCELGRSSLSAATVGRIRGVGSGCSLGLDLVEPGDQRNAYRCWPAPSCRAGAWGRDQGARVVASDRPDVDDVRAACCDHVRQAWRDPWTVVGRY